MQQRKLKMSFLLKLTKSIHRLDDRINTLVRTLKTKVFLLKGANKCSICGAKHLHFSNPDSEGTVFRDDGSKTRMIMHWWLKDYENICPDCVLKKIKKVFSGPITTAHDGLHQGTCDFTGQQNVPVIGIIWGTDDVSRFRFNLRFGGSWWNGHNASYEAFDQAIRSCQMKTSIMKCVGKKLFYIQKDMLFEAQSYAEWKAKQ